MLLLHNNIMIAVVSKGQAKRFISIARQAGIKGGTVIPARGTASSKVLGFLGLGDTSKEMVLVVLEKELEERIVSEARANGHIHGVAALLGSTKEDGMETKWKMITIIVNTGYADDIMDAARKAGASGGTVTHARGTGTPEDVKFLGVSIVPDKEMIMIVCEADKTEQIMNAITSLKCLEEPGVGVIYTQDVLDFKNLDPKK